MVERDAALQVRQHRLDLRQVLVLSGEHRHRGVPDRLHLRGLIRLEQIKLLKRHCLGLDLAFRKGKDDDGVVLALDHEGHELEEVALHLRCGLRALLLLALPLLPVRVSLAAPAAKLFRHFKMLIYEGGKSKSLAEFV